MRISDWSSDVCSSDLIVADLIIGFKMFRERFTSRVHPDAAARRIDVTYAEGPFKYLENHWVFEDHPQGCLIDFYVDFEFRSKLLQKVIEGLFHEAVRSEERRVGQECVSTYRSRWSPSH